MVALTLYLDAYSKKQIRNRLQIKKIIEKNAVRSCPQKRTTLIVAYIFRYLIVRLNYTNTNE